eukprot:SAG25_NODE_51_length_18768_cov_901.153731_6_plen_162_part_00
MCVRLNTVHWTGCDRSIRTPQQLRGLTSIELKSMGVKANMRLDQKTIDTVLAAVRRGKLPDSHAGESYYDRQRRERREREEAARSSSTSRLCSSTTSRLGSSLSSDADKLKEYMESCGLEAWHAHFVKHTCVAHSTLTLKRMLPSRCQQAKPVRRLRVCTP